MWAVMQITKWGWLARQMRTVTTHPRLKLNQLRSLTILMPDHDRNGTTVLNGSDTENFLS
jgi:hypothetical protein